MAPIARILHRCSRRVSGSSFMSWALMDGALAAGEINARAARVRTSDFMAFHNMNRFLVQMTV
ncbi:MAG: hypothetical protein ACRECW_07105 [Phyllobacterium sp.]